MKLAVFMKKVSELGYNVEHKSHQYLGGVPLDDVVVISENDYYRVQLHYIPDVPFESIMNHVKREMEKLKENNK